MTSVASDSEDASWPIENVVDDHQINLWRAVANDQSAELTVVLPNMSPYANAVFIGNTNAASGTVTVYDSTGTGTPLVASQSMNFITSGMFTFFTQKRLETFAAAWVDWTNQTQGVVLKITLQTSKISDIAITAGGTGYTAGKLTAAGAGSGFYGTYTVDSDGAIDSVHISDGGVRWSGGETLTPSDPGEAGSGATFVAYSTVNCGVIRAGFAKNFSNPNMGFAEGFEDYSIYKDLHSGAEYVKRRKMVRTFSGDLWVKLTELNDLNNVSRQSRITPLAWNLLGTENRGLMFGKLTAMPSSKRTHMEYMTTSLKFKEVL